MAVLTANDFAQQMIAQARVLDPSLSGEIGTPERKVFDTVAQALAENQIDLTGLAGALDIDSKFGSNLDRFVTLFGFQRQQPVVATGYVVFSRNTPAPATITIPLGSVVQANAITTDTLVTMQYTTTAGGTIPLGATASGAIPVQAIVAGPAGNAAANTLNIMVGAPLPGITAVTNPNPLTNGADGEDDNTLKVRFKNTWARNLAGTHDQYLALAVAGAFTTKANVVGAQSRFHEYVQVPDFDDAGYINGTRTLAQDTGGTQNLWTTAASTLPYAKQVYTTTDTFLSNGQTGIDQFFYRPGVDFIFNFPAQFVGDTQREAPTTTASGAQTTSSAPFALTVGSTTGFPDVGGLLIEGSIFPYTSKAPTVFNCSGGNSISVPNGTTVYGLPGVTQPNYTFPNVFAASTPIEGLQAVNPGSILLAEYSYVSSASRNDLGRNIDNAVDVYVNGANDVQTSCVFLPNLTFTQPINQNPTSTWYYENFRRDGQPAKRPQVGNFITTLFQSPLDALPKSITINGQNYYEGWHYWLVHEVGALAGSIRARDGIEWNANLGGDTGAETPPDDPTQPYAPTGATIVGVSAAGNLPIEVDNYLYDANVPALQASLEEAKQITTDVLAHRAITRYFKLDVTVMYSANANFAVTNSAIGTSVQAFMDRQYFGSVIQLSDLLDVVHQVAGVDNVRWSNDLSNPPNTIRVRETDVGGLPLDRVTVDRLLYGSASVTEQQTLYVVGDPVGQFALSWTDPTIPGAGHVMTTANIPFNTLTAATLQSAIQAAAIAASVTTGVYNNITVTQDSRPSTNVVRPILSFTITYGAHGTPVLPVETHTITASDYAFNSDFFLLDNELPSLPTTAAVNDTVPGLIIRPRVQGTWVRPGLG